MPRLFKAQSLEDVCIFIGGPGIPIKPLGTLGEGRRQLGNELLTLRSWFFCFPSARQSWASVYQHSKSGALDMTLPRATVAFNVRSLRRVRDCYVTSLTAIDVVANEEPFDFASTHPQVMQVSALAVAATATHAQRLAPKPSLRSFTPVTEAEWAELAPLLESRVGAKADDSRRVLNAIMWKHSEGARWQEVFAEFGNEVARAPTSLSRWKRDGRWDAALGRLDEIRSACQ
ncbi:transposase [Rubrivivax sp. RP6-9]|uniref:transposase n=1 Tax=Rubrivivax sp. RP6-9 TaxID=3415750 RepID=UPI003CC689F5